MKGAKYSLSSERGNLFNYEYYFYYLSRNLFSQNQLGECWPNFFSKSKGDSQISQNNVPKCEKVVKTTWI